MKWIHIPPGIRNQVIIVSGLALSAIVLAIVVSGLGEKPAVPGTGKDTPLDAVRSSGFEGDLNAVCAQFGIPEKTIRLRKVTDRAGRLLRREYRIAVPKDFSSIEFNHALNRRVESAGARVMGTEQTRDRTVTLHVLQDDKTVMSVILDLKQ